MTTRTNAYGLGIATELYNFVSQEVLPGLGIEENQFWEGAASIVKDLTPRNRQLLEIRRGGNDSPI